eukprot:GHVS01081229.1.p1 GENE.GHVS01081229.1~~GHVS01081229.1.p1  ORF type:complete len:396 (+),score=37.65 GHVS01081229.1:139-1188(+)
MVAPAFAAMLRKPQKVQQEVPWVEKYRPRVLDEVSHQDEAMRMLKTVVQSGNMPHLLFHGPPGTGKTSSILALANELFGKELRSERVKELNASDDRGIAAVRDKVKVWSRYEPRGGSVHPVTGRPLPSWKIVVLDEADMMTADAQSALRRVMEEYSRSTRFVIICNYFHKIIDPLASRCSVYRFQSISADAQVARLSHICVSENIKLASDRVLDTMHIVSEGDLRRAVTLLQTASAFYDTLEEATIYEVAGYPPSNVSTDLLSSCRQSVKKMEESVDRIHSDGWDISVLTRQLCSLVTESEDTTSVQKARMHLCLAERDYGILMGGSDYLNLISIGRSFCSIIGTAATN